MPASSEAAAATVVLEGMVSIRAALEAGCRPLNVILVRWDVRGREIERLEPLAAARGVPVRRVTDTALAHAAHGRLHGGIVALGGPRDAVALDTLGRDQPAPFVVMLDGLEDPYTFGHALRALYAAGVDGVIVRPRVWGTAEGTIARASAGAFDRLPLARAANPLAVFEALRARGLCVACAAEAPEAVSVYASPLAPPCVLVIGGERRGISRALLERADLLVRIPYGSSFRHSLGLTAAASILAFEVGRRR